MRKIKRFAALLLSACVTVSSLCISSTVAEASEGGFDIAVVNFDAVMEGTDLEEQNLSKMKEDIQEGIDTDQEIMVFPEYALTSKKDDAIDISSDESVAEIAKLADDADMYILFGATIEEESNIYSAMIICNQDGHIDTYKKTHLSDEEYEEGFSVGDDPYVLSTEYGNFGIALGDEFADVAELGKYYYGSSCRMILVGQSMGYEESRENGLTQAEYDLYTGTYAYVRMYSRAVAVANLYTSDGEETYFGESHVCTSYQNGWVAGGNDTKTAPATTVKAGLETIAIGATSNDTSNGMSSRRLNLLADWYEDLTDYEMPVYGEGSKYKDNVKVASVNFQPEWGDLEANVAEMEKLMEDAHEDGVELLVFPEMALTGYSVVKPEDYSETEKEKFGDDYMQHALAQVVRGDSPSDVIVEIQKLAKDYGMYVVFGLPERDETDADTYYNSVAMLGPDLIQSYRKVNLASPEPNWACYGTDNDGYFETPFGYVGVGICADIYNYQELQRTYAQMGCRIVINCTAGAANTSNIENGGWELTYQNRLESFMLRDNNFMITSNLVGYEGPELSEELTEKLSEAGYTKDDITNAWLYSANTELNSLLYDGTKALLNSRACIFPGGSVCMALDSTSSTGTKVYGNTADSATIIPYTNQELGPYLDIDGDGKNAYLNYTTDTFNQYYTGDFDLSNATLETFYNENPYDYRADLYAKWYSELFYNTYGYTLDDTTLTDSDTGVSVAGKMLSGSTLLVTKSAASGENLSGYSLVSSDTYNVSLSLTMTTDVMHTNSTNTAYGASTIPYTGNYEAALEDVEVSIPVSKSADKVLINGEGAVVSNGVATVTTASTASLLVNVYEADVISSEVPVSTETPVSSETTVTSEVPVSASAPVSSETPTASEAPSVSVSPSASSSAKPSSTVKAPKTLKVKISRSVTKAAAKTAKVKMVAKQQIRISTTVSPSNASSKVTYKVTSGKRYVSVSTEGVITAKKAGTAKISVISNADSSVKATITVTVAKKRVVNKVLKVSTSSVKVSKGKTKTINVTQVTSSTTDRVSFSSSNSKVVKVDTFGVVTGVKKGTATITVKCGSLRKKVKVTVL